MRRRVETTQGCRPVLRRVKRLIGTLYVSEMDKWREVCDFTPSKFLIGTSYATEIHKRPFPCCASPNLWVARVPWLGFSPIRHMGSCNIGNHVRPFLGWTFTTYAVRTPESSAVACESLHPLYFWADAFGTL